MKIEINEIKTIVFCKDANDIHKYFKLFRFLLGDRVVESQCRKDFCVIRGTDFRIEFRTLLQSSRGHKAHYVINMVQDEELNYLVALPITVIHGYLEGDEKWKDVLL